MTNGPNISKKNRIVQNPLKYQTESAAHIPPSLLEAQYGISARSRDV